MNMIAGPAQKGDHGLDDEPFIGSLSESFGVPSEKVMVIYREQLRRLSVGARIRNFLRVLAITKTRDALREERGRRALPGPGAPIPPPAAH